MRIHHILSRLRDHHSNDWRMLRHPQLQTDVAARVRLLQSSPAYRITQPGDAVKAWQTWQAAVAVYMAHHREKAAPEAC